jgi:hypothetical protein
MESRDQLLCSAIPPSFFFFPSIDTGLDFFCLLPVQTVYCFTMSLFPNLLIRHPPLDHPLAGFVCSFGHNFTSLSWWRNLWRLSEGDT